MTIFVSQRANLRPEFTQTRDPLPWDASKSRPTPMGQLREFARFGTREEALVWAGIAGIVSWSPRHDEFDPPVNQILMEIRDESELRPTSYARELAHLNRDSLNWEAYGPLHDQMRAHARRVLTLVAALS